jgi:Flp pilus assembly pilin Flp
MEAKVSGGQKDEIGATAVEYCILAALVAGLIVGAVTALGIATNGLFQTIPPWY